MMTRSYTTRKAPGGVWEVVEIRVTVVGEYDHHDTAEAILAALEAREARQTNGEARQKPKSAPDVAGPTSIDLPASGLPVASGGPSGIPVAAAGKQYAPGAASAFRRALIRGAVAADARIDRYPGAQTLTDCPRPSDPDEPSLPTGAD